MTWATSAQALLDAAAGATLTSEVKRAVVVPGGTFARDCRMLAVYLDTFDTLPTGQGELPGGQGCVKVPVLTLTCVFVADCYPAPTDNGTMPTPAVITAWTTAFLADTEAIWNAIADAAEDGSLGDCDGVSINPASQTSGPGGKVSEVQISVRVLPG